MTVTAAALLAGCCSIGSSTPPAPRQPPGRYGDGQLGRGSTARRRSARRSRRPHWRNRPSPSSRRPRSATECLRPACPACRGSKVRNGLLHSGDRGGTDPFKAATRLIGGAPPSRPPPPGSATARPGRVGRARGPDADRRQRAWRTGRAKGSAPPFSGRIGDSMMRRMLRVPAVVARPHPAPCRRVRCGGNSAPRVPA